MSEKHHSISSQESKVTRKTKQSIISTKIGRQGIESVCWNCGATSQDQEETPMREFRSAAEEKEFARKKRSLDRLALVRVSADTENESSQSREEIVAELHARLEAKSPYYKEIRRRALEAKRKSREKILADVVTRRIG